jgi:hypothetical protein
MSALRLGPVTIASEHWLITLASFAGNSVAIMARSRDSPIVCSTSGRSFIARIRPAGKKTDGASSRAK